MQNFLKKVFITAMFLAIALNALPQKTLTLDEAMAVAIKNSPEIMKSELNMTISQENLNARMAGTKSQFSFDITPFNYSQSRKFNDFYSVWYTNENKNIGGSFIISQPLVLTNGTFRLENRLFYQDAFSEAPQMDTITRRLVLTNNRLKSYNNSLTLSYSQPLFTYNRQKMEINQLKLDLENTTLGYSLQRLYLEQQVTRLFFGLYQNKMSLQVAEEELKNQKISYEIIKSKVEGGLSAKEQLLQAELNLAQSESNLQNKKVELENAMDEFRKYIGMSIHEEIEINANVDFKLILVDMQKAIESGMATRMELRQRQIDIENSYKSLIEAKATNEFAGNLAMSVGVDGDNTLFPHIYDKPTRSPQLGITLQIPIWDWGQRKSRIKAAEANIKIQEINLEDQKTDIEIAIRQSFRSLQNLILQIEIAKQSEKNAQLTYDINLERYKNGDLTSMDLGRFQNQLSTAKMNLVNSLINYKLELLNMKIQSLWDFETNSSFVPSDLKSNIESNTMK